MTDDTLLKTCTKCKEAKSISEYGKRGDAPDGLKFRCRLCECARGREYYKHNRERVLARTSKYYQDNLEYYKAYQLAWIQENKEKKANASKRRRTENPEKESVQSAKWYRENKAHAKKYADEYRKKNPDIYKAANANRRARRRDAGGTYTAKDIRALYQTQDARCVYCDASLAEKYHADHIMPLSRGGSNYIENIQLLCPPCNLSKGARDPEYFKRLREIPLYP